MILDRGICTVFAKTDTSGKGEMPKPGYTVKTKSWYGELSFETAPRYATDKRQDTRTDARIRIYQDRQINDHDVVALMDVDTLPQPPVQVYRVTRAYHGLDDDNGELVTDLTLEVLEA